MSEIKVNKISPRSGTTVTLGDSGDTFTIPSGATINNQGTATNFGATGSASWVTTVKTSTFTAVAGEGYFVNTTGGAVTVNLPAGTAGAVVAVKDYANTFDTNACTLVQNGSDKIGGSTVNAILSTEGLAVTLVFIDSTQGWLVTDSGLQSEAPGSLYVTATGGTVTCSGDFKIHTFTGPGTFCVSCAGNSGGNNQIEYLVVAGGGSGGTENGQSVAGGGGGAGGFRFASPSISPLTYPAKPLAGSTITVPASAIPITVGAGGAVAPSSPGRNPGNNSVFSSITSTAGGGGGFTGGCGASPSPTVNDRSGDAGGSGGGAAHGVTGLPGGAGNSPAVTPAQGQNGGAATPGVYLGGGGGGAICAGTRGGNQTGPGGDGGGLPTAFGSNGVSCGSFRYYAGGGGGGGSTNRPETGPAGAGGKGGGAAGGAGQNPAPAAATVNTGGGGGGGGNLYPGAGSKLGSAGGSGIVVIRYKFQN